MEPVALRIEGEYFLTSYKESMKAKIYHIFIFVLCNVNKRYNRIFALMPELLHWPRRLLQVEDSYAYAIKRRFIAEGDF
jgi:hypothetical protein